MNHLIITGNANTDGKDFTGAFDPEAKGYMEYWTKKGDTCTRIFVDVKKPYAQRIIDLTEKLKATTGAFDAVAIFCHGWSTGIQVGLSIKSASERVEFQRFMDDLARRLRGVSPKIGLYCCSTGKDARETKEPNTAPGTGDNSFADQFRDRLCQDGFQNCIVFAHSTAGHTATNPDVRYFYGMGSQLGGIGGVTPAPRRTSAYKALRKLLATPERYELPFYSIEELHKRLVLLGA